MSADKSDAPQNLYVGVINPYALVETLTGKSFDWKQPDSVKILSDVLHTDYEELFDMKFDSPLYAGLKLNPSTNSAEPVKPSELTILKPADLVPPPVHRIQTLGDLEAFEVPNIASLPVKSASVQNGKLNLVLNVPGPLGKRLTNTTLTQQLADLVIPKPDAGTTNVAWTPPGATWRDMGDFFKDVTEYNDPIQGAVANCYLIAAMSAVAWADPYDIVHRNRATGVGETDRVNGIQFYTKGGGHDAPTSMVEVTDKTIVNTISSSPIYCRSNDAGEIWPALYEKAFAKWITGNTTDFPDITQTAYGDPAKATAQITGKTPYYYYTNAHTADELYQFVRSNSLSYKTINPMTAWTYATGAYAGTNIVANHAYTVLGWAYNNSKEYIVLRNPWGVTEPSGLNTYQGLLSFFDNSFWRPINTIGNDGIFALEASAFKTYYACLGVAK